MVNTAVKARKRMGTASGCHEIAVLRVTPAMPNGGVPLSNDTSNPPPKVLNGGRQKRSRCGCCTTFVLHVLLSTGCFGIFSKLPDL